MFNKQWEIFVLNYFIFRITLSKIRLSHLGQIALSVKQKHWRKGIGNQMMKTLIQWAKNNNFKKLNLEVTTTNEGAISLYKKHDFIIEGTNKRSMMIKGNYIDTYYMGLVLD
ncbi:MAG: GNAT family N-acetyltransferase [Candidatus Heimdallarchaeota archaeon]